MEQFDAIIIGAGPAGMMAAIRAAERKRSVLLIERNNALGEKLLISGAARCNLTHSGDIEDFLEKFSASRSFLRNVFARFFNTELVSFFQQAGMQIKTEPNGRVFPESNRAGDVLKVLKARLKTKNIKILTGERARKIIIQDKKIAGVLTYSRKHFVTRRVAIATGGVSYPQTGSTGDGYQMAQELGHKITPLQAALSPILIKERFVRDWQGIALQNVRLSLFAGSKKIDQGLGEIVFTHFGLSGPVALDLSASIPDVSALKNDAVLSINFKPALDHNNLNTRLLEEFKAGPRKNIKNILRSLLPQGIIKRFLEYCRINASKEANQITTEERNGLIRALLDFRLKVEGLMPVKDAMLTRGGVNTKEINPRTMESRLVQGLFFAGELIDIDAKTGGYNMQAAFSTGWVCGDNL